MKFNLKTVSITFLFIILVLIIGYFLFSPGIMLLNTTPPEKLISFSNASVRGWNKGNKSFELYAEKGWSECGGNITCFENVFGGKVYDKNKVTIKDITAGQVKLFRNSEAVFARTSTEETGEKLSFKINIERDKAKEKWATISLNELSYDPIKKTIFMIGNILIKEDDNFITSNLAEYNNEIRNMVLDEKVTLRSKDLRVASDKLKIDQDKKLYVFENNVSIAQPGKVAYGKKADYSEKENLITLTDGAKLILEKAKKLLNGPDVEKMKSGETRKALEEKTILECRTLKISTKTSDALAYDNVKVFQNDKVAKADNASYSSKDDSITLTGNVYLKKDNDWIRTQKIIVWVKTEKFEAVGKVETEFKLKKK